MDTVCKWYISALEPECGAPAVAVVTHIPLRSGAVKKLDIPLPVCQLHKSHTDTLFAALRTKGKVTH
jgi:hypothetical protein